MTSPFLPSLSHADKLSPEEPKHSDDGATEQGGLGRFWAELKRRHVVRVATVYLVVGWLVIQVANATFEDFGIPLWAYRFVVLMVALGFPISVVVAWAFELTPQGIKTTKVAKEQKAEEPTSSAFKRKRRWFTILFAAGLPTLIFGSLALYFFLNRAGPEAESDHSIAVLPLINMSPDEDNIYFANGVHEDILTDLSKIDGFQVISRTSMLRYASSDLSVPQIGSELSARYVVEGSVRRFENHVRVTIQLIDARNDHHLWASNFERELANVFETQSDLAREISNSIQLEIAPESIQSLQDKPTTNALAYDLYLKAISIEKSEGETVESTLRKQKLLEKAVKEDPNFVEAWGQLKRMYDLMLKRIRERSWTYNAKNIEKLAEDLRSRSTRALTKAITLDPNNVESLLASVVNHVEPQPPEVLEERKKVYERILAENPDHAMSLLHYGWWHTHMQPPDEAGAKIYFEKVLTVDPFNVRLLEAVMTFYRSRDSVRHEELAKRLEQIVPETAEERQFAKRGPKVNLLWTFYGFMETADASLWAEFASRWKEFSSTNPSRDAQYIRLESLFLIGSNDLEGFLESVDRIPPPDLDLEGVDVDAGPALNFLFWNVRAMSWLQVNGREQEARKYADRILPYQSVSSVPEIDFLKKAISYALAKANAFLGNTETAKTLAKEIEDAASSQGDESGDPWDMVDAVLVWAWIDAEHAASLFYRIPETQRARVMGSFAFSHAESHSFLLHPKIQAEFVKDGRWLDYLAERMPEYAELKSKP